MTIMVVLEHTMSKENRTSGNTQNAVYIKSTTSSRPIEWQNSVSFSCVLFLLFLLVDVYTGKSMFTNMNRIQQREMNRPINFAFCTLNSFQQEFLVLMVIAWKTLKRQVMLIDILLETLWTYKISLHPTSSNNSFHPKTENTSGSPLERINKVFDVNICISIISMIFNVHSLLQRIK